MRGGPWLALRSAPRSPERAYLALPLGGAPNLVGVVSLASRFEGGGGRAEHGELELLGAQLVRCTFGVLAEQENGDSAYTSLTTRPPGKSALPADTQA